jgi:hypothetical protein
MRRLLLSLLALASLGAAGIAVAAGAFDGAKPATARFHDIRQARAAGYTVPVADVNGVTCIAEPGVGAMGVHMLNPSLLDGVVDAERPEILVYEPRPNGQMRLVALEYLVLKEHWTGAEPPSLFGQTFAHNPKPNRFDLDFYALHAWIWKPNPSGILSPWNPRVRC